MFRISRTDMWKEVGKCCRGRGGVLKVENEEGMKLTTGGKRVAQREKQ